MIFKDNQYKTVTLKGLNITKHSFKIEKLREKGWVPYLTKPDTKNLQVIYHLKKFGKSLGEPLTNFQKPREKADRPPQT